MLRFWKIAFWRIEEGLWGRVTSVLFLQTSGAIDSKRAIFNEKGDCDEKIKIRIRFAKITYLKMKNILLQKTLPIATEQVLHMTHLVVRSGTMKCGYNEECFGSPEQCYFIIPSWWDVLFLNLILYLWWYRINHCLH